MAYYSLSMKRTKEEERMDRIRGKLQLAGYNFSKISVIFSCSRQFVNQCVQGVHNSEKANAIREFIARKMGVEFDDIF